MQVNRRNLVLLPQKALAQGVNTLAKKLYPSISEVVGEFQKNLIRAYWWADVRNFGDLITPALLRAYGLTPVYCGDAKSASLVATGSIIGRLPPDYCGIVLGSGLLSDNPNLRYPKARIMALRGELTKERLDICGKVPLGDPGLLAADLLPERTSSKRYVLGIVPHYEDRDNAIVHAIVKRYPREVRVINVQRSPITVIREIDNCQFILSSSLHGVVVADALSIPNCWAVLSNRLIGGTFKFRDYYSAFAVERRPLQPCDSPSLNSILNAMNDPPPGISERQIKLRSLFSEVGKQFSKNGSEEIHDR